MQKLGRTIARFGAARAFLAGAALLAGAAGPVGGKRASDPVEDTALAIPRVALPGDPARVALPQPLAPSEAERIRRIFALQARRDVPAAIAECDRLSDRILLPHILADRYLGSGNRAAKPDELTDWLAAYRDLPDAPAIYTLLTRLSRDEAARIEAPPPLPSLRVAAPAENVEPTAPLFPRHAAIDRAVRATARLSPERALALIGRLKGLDRAHAAQLRAEVAQILFTGGRDAEALAVAEAAGRAAPEVGLAPLIAGLASWRLDRPQDAAPLFEAAFAARLIQPGERAGAAFWAARAHMRLRQAEEYAPWLRRAAESGRTFYGLLARRALGRPLRAEPAVEDPTLGEADVDAVAATPSGRRAFALLQVGQDARASAELRMLWSESRDRPAFTRSIMLVAKQAGLRTLAAELASLFEPAPVNLPSRRLRPTGGFRTDPALLYALARLESNFDPTAVSPAGARGMMQLMPSTIDYLLGGAQLGGVHDPAVSLDLGQRYLLTLARYDLVGGDLIRLLAGYNSGPGGLAKWIGAVHHNGDPLLFIESVPNDETRAYIPRALAYTWLYAAELRLPSPSLDELAAGSWPRFRNDAAAAPMIARLH